MNRCSMVGSFALSLRTGKLLRVGGVSARTRVASGAA